MSASLNIHIGAGCLTWPRPGAACSLIKPRCLTVGSSWTSRRVTTFPAAKSCSSKRAKTSSVVYFATSELTSAINSGKLSTRPNASEKRSSVIQSVRSKARQRPSQGGRRMPVAISPSVVSKTTKKDPGADSNHGGICSNGIAGLSSA